MTDTVRIAKDRLKSFVERVERLETEKQEVSAGISEVYAEAKGEGFDVKALKHVVSLRRKDKAERDEQDALIDLYKTALGL